MSLVNLHTLADFATSLKKLIVKLEDSRDVPYFEPGAAGGGGEFEGEMT